MHEVTVSDFYLAKYEVTVGQFRQFVNETGYRTTAEREGGAQVWTGSKWERRAEMNWRKPSFYQGDRHPVVCVSWYDAVEFCNWLSRKERIEECYRISGTSVSCDWRASGYRLPTEAEWEYAARSGGKTYKYSWGNGSPSGNIADETGKKAFPGWAVWEGYEDGYVYTAPVGRFAANEAGLYDMSGNVLEWCWDWWGREYYGSSARTDPRGSEGGDYRVMRAGSWCDAPILVRAGYRGNNRPDFGSYRLGFRLACHR